MPVNIEVDYSPALTEGERLLLISIESSIAEFVWDVLSIPRTRWTPWQDEKGRTLYILTPWDRRAEVIVHYSEIEIRKLTEAAVTLATAKTDIALGRRNQVQPGFSERPETEGV